ncbi:MULTISPECIES: patatin-like phospholipase family protein [unclassified Roseitalea]|uniref:patatin-like phospholipase family protein n=1 Tax=unclassified Roseitalea TaxID=2639107 RepID=UPI00273D8F88|nr:MULTISPECIES: patatin-like phospholipase family protein [unclassified Roseitalea]
MASSGERAGNGTAKPVNLALQGGGSHGAFTWGVLDALLEDGRLDFDGVSGTSAGAMNAVALADGWQRGGAEGARECLAAFWEAIARKGRFSPLQRTPADIWFGNFSYENSPTYRFFDIFSRVFSPYDVNVLDYNPLREVLVETIDFDRVHRCAGFKVFVSATNVHNGKVRVFHGEEVTADVVMASACLPTLYKAVEIDGIPYWDGGFGGNPVLFPFFYETQTEDCLLVQINPIEREATPQTAQEIQDRMNEITFNAGLLREFRAIEFVRRLKADGRLEGTDYRSTRMHRIAADAVVKDLSASSKLNTEWSFLTEMRDTGRAAAQDFLEAHFADIGVRASLDLSEELRADILPVSEREPVGKRMRKAMKRLSRDNAREGGE